MASWDWTSAAPSDLGLSAAATDQYYLEEHSTYLNASFPMSDPSSSPYGTESYTTQPTYHHVTMNPYDQHSHHPTVTYAPTSTSYLAPEPYQSYSSGHLSPSSSHYYSSGGYISHGGSSVGSNNSPTSQILDDFDDDGFDTYGYEGQVPYPTSSDGSNYHSHHHHSHGHHASVSGGTVSGVGADGVPYYMCDHAGCSKVCARLCDLRKHKKRHQKPFPCRNRCESYFSTEKDRDRHERSKHKKEEWLTCAVCGHQTARKDNMKDHVRRRHGEHDLERIMDATMANAYP